MTSRLYEFETDIQGQSAYIAYREDSDGFACDVSCHVYDTLYGDDVPIQLDKMTQAFRTAVFAAIEENQETERQYASENARLAAGDDRMQAEREG